MQPELTGENEESPQRSLAPLKVPDVGEFFHSRTGGDSGQPKHVARPLGGCPNMWYLWVLPGGSAPSRDAPQCSSCLFYRLKICCSTTQRFELMTTTQADFARLRGVSRKQVTEWKRDGYLVFDSRRRR